MSLARDALRHQHLFALTIVSIGTANDTPINQSLSLGRAATMGRTTNRSRLQVIWAHLVRPHPTLFEAIPYLLNKDPSVARPCIHGLANRMRLERDG